MARLVIIAALLCLAAEARGQTVADALPYVNAKRVSMGLYPFTPAADLTAEAKYESALRAARGVTGHLPNGCAPGRAEGVGWTGSRDPAGQNFFSCFHSGGGGGGRFFRRGGGNDYTTKYRYAGAAAAVSPRGATFYTLILR